MHLVCMASNNEVRVVLLGSCCQPVSALQICSSTWLVFQDRLPRKLVEVT